MIAIMKFIMGISQNGMMNVGKAYPRSKNFKSGQRWGERAIGTTRAIPRARVRIFMIKRGEKVWQRQKKLRNH